MSEQNFDFDTMGVLLAGKIARSGELTRGQIADLATAVQRLGEAEKLPLKMLPSGDLTSDSGPADDETCYCALAFGIEITRGGTDEPDPVPLDGLLSKLNAAKRIPATVWAKLAEMLSENERADFNEQEVGVQLICVGPLSQANLVFGVTGGEEDAGEGEYIGGRNMSQDKHDSGVWGLPVASCEYESAGSTSVDFSEGAHQERLASCPKGQYFLIARYD
jgi:hypothetical protein